MFFFNILFSISSPLCFVLAQGTLLTVENIATQTHRGKKRGDVQIKTCFLMTELEQKVDLNIF